MNFKCLRCEKLLPVDEYGCVDGGGRFTITFGFGSRHDQAISYPNSPDPVDRLLACRIIQGAVCDDCLSVHHSLFVGYALPK